MKLASILSLLSRPKITSAELREARAAIDIAGAEAAIDTLEERRRALLLTDDEAALEQTGSAIKAATRLLDRQHEAARALDRRIEQAVEVERVADIEATANNAREARSRQIEHLAAVDRLAADIADRLAKIVADRATIRAANQVVLAANRPDLKTSDPAGELAQLLGFANSDGLPDPTRWALAGYWPRADQFGAPVNAARPLARIRELLHDSAIKKAA